jgi:hypothetical protein
MVFANICELMTPLLAGPSRGEIVAAAAKAPRLADALDLLAVGVGRHAFQVSAGPVRFAKLIQRFDSLTRAEGFHALNDWDGVSDDVNDETIPIDVLRYIADLRRNDATDPRVLAILLDYYFLHVLALMALRIWDDGDANTNLDRLDGLRAALQGPNGSGHRFADDAATLILIATCHYEREERGFELLLDRVRTLNRAHQLKIAIGHASSLGGHLRFGYEATYAKDVTLMREDNAADYPWLRWAVLTLFAELEATPAPANRVRTAVVEALVGGLTADAALFAADPEIAPRLAAHRSELQAAFERYRPQDVGYSPQAFFFNFSHNVLKGAVIDAMLWGEPWGVSLNDLLSSRDEVPEAAPIVKRRALATTLMDYARKNPHRISGRLLPAIVYDPATGRRAFAAAAKTLNLD